MVATHQHKKNLIESINFSLVQLLTLFVEEAGTALNHKLEQQFIALRDNVIKQPKIFSNNTFIKIISIINDWLNTIKSSPNIPTPILFSSKHEIDKLTEFKEKLYHAITQVICNIVNFVYNFCCKLCFSDKNQNLVVETSKLKIGAFQILMNNIHVYINCFQDIRNKLNIESNLEAKASIITPKLK